MKSHSSTKSLYCTLLFLLVFLCVQSTTAQTQLKVVNNHPLYDCVFSLEYGSKSSCKVDGMIRNFIIRKKGTITLQIPENSPDLMMISVKDDHQKGLNYLFTASKECPQLARKEENKGIVVITKKNRISINPF